MVNIEWFTVVASDRLGDLITGFLLFLVPNGGLSERSILLVELIQSPSIVKSRVCLRPSLSALR